MLHRVQIIFILTLLITGLCLNVSASSEEDSDGDGWTDYHEDSCGTDPLNNQDVPLDSDSSGICDSLDPDDDNDGWWDDIEAICGTNPVSIESVPVDVDGNGVCDSLENDTDGDGWSDFDEILCESSINDNNSIPFDLQDDGKCEVLVIRIPDFIDPFKQENRPIPGSIQLVAFSSVTLITAGALYSFEPFRWSASRKFWLSLLLLFGFVRKTSDGEFQRGRLYGYIESNPGIHLSALTRLSGLGNNQATYHLDRLEKEGRIWSIREGRLLVFFADSVPVGNPISSPILEINFSKNSIKRAILMELNKVDLMDIKEPNGGQLAKEIGISPQVISYHLRSLIRWEMVNRKRIGLKVSLSITKLGIEALTSADLDIES